jgi:purine-binding chemotaxis protein CheW
MSDTQQLVIFSLAGEEYALPITRVQEIIRYSQPRSVASSFPWIRGVINLRGKIVPVCDLAMRLGVSHTHADAAKIAVVETNGGTAGVIVDTVEEVLTVTNDQIESVASADSEYVDGVAKLGPPADPAQPRRTPVGHPRRRLSVSSAGWR